MTTTIGIDLQQLKDLITTGNSATQKQITDLSSRMEERFAKLEQLVEVGFAEVKGDIKELRAELKGLDAKFDEKLRSANY
jgi:peptidoglycan hydrolase CwlO-like protein